MHCGALAKHKDKEHNTHTHKQYSRYFHIMLRSWAWSLCVCWTARFAGSRRGRQNQRSVRIFVETPWRLIAVDGVDIDSWRLYRNSYCFKIIAIRLLMAPPSEYVSGVFQAGVASWPSICRRLEKQWSSYWVVDPSVARANGGSIAEVYRFLPSRDRSVFIAEKKRLQWVGTPSPRHLQSHLQAPSFIIQGWNEIQGDLVSPWQVGKLLMAWEKRQGGRGRSRGPFSSTGRQISPTGEFISHHPQPLHISKLGLGDGENWQTICFL